MTRANQEFFTKFRKEISGDVTPPTDLELIDIPALFCPGREPLNSLAYTRRCIARDEESNQGLKYSIEKDEVVTILKSKIEEQEKIIRGKNEYIARLESERNVAENFMDDENCDSERLDTAQVIVLFESLLNVPLNASQTNISALSKLIAKVSGYKDSAVRAKINQKRDYENPKVRRDVEMLIKLLNPINREKELPVVSKLKENLKM